MFAFDVVQWMAGKWFWIARWATLIRPNHYVDVSSTLHKTQNTDSVSLFPAWMEMICIPFTAALVRTNVTLF